MQIIWKGKYIFVVSAILTRIAGIFAGLGKPARAFAFFPFLVSRHEHLPEWVIRHEIIHFEQQKELLLIFHTMLYTIELYYWRFIRGMKPMDAYLWTSSEQEAYIHMHDTEYLSKRKRFSVFRYFFRKNKKKFSLDPKQPGKLLFLWVIPVVDSWFFSSNQ